MSNLMNALEAILTRIRNCWRRALSHVRRDGPSGMEVLRVLPALENELDMLSKSTEGEFLSLGENLQDFYRRAKEISNIAASVNSLMTGEEIESSITGFREVIARIENLEEESLRNLGILQRLVEILSSLHRHLSGFYKIIRSLRVLCVYTRIESAGLGARDIGFNVLADEVGKLALEIEEKYSHILEQTESLSALIGQTLLKASDLENRQHVQAALIIENTMSSLTSLTQRHGSSSEDAASIVSRYDAISRNIGEIVGSMQFHDITRQRIEHAREALEGIHYEQGASGATEDGGDGKRRLLPFRDERLSQREESRRQLILAGPVCELQIAQLHHARDGLVAAVEKIIRNLRQVAEFVAEMSQETQRMAGAADKSGRSFLSEVESGLASVAAAFDSYAAVDRELSSIMGSVGSTLGSMSAYASAIEGIGSRIKLIALNAIVKASHIGDEGKTLSVLAESIHQLSGETCDRTEAVGGALRSMTAESEALCAQTDPGEAGHGEQSTRVHEALKSLFASLEKTSQGIVTLLERMNDEGSTLSEDILKTVGAVEVHHRIDAALSGVASRLEEIALSSGSLTLNPLEDKRKTVERIQALEASYTMHEERAVHSSMVAANAVLEKPDSELFALPETSETGGEKHAEESGNESEEDLGDNVELF